MSERGLFYIEVFGITMSAIERHVPSIIFAQ